VRDDEHPALPPADDPDLTLDVGRATLEAVSFADQLRVAHDAAPEFIPLEVPAAEPVQPAAPAPTPRRSRRRHRLGEARAHTPEARRLCKALVEAGLPARIAREIVAETVTHLLPFGDPDQLTQLACTALARRIPVRSGAPAGPIVLAGPAGAGKTLCAARIAAAYAAAGVRVVCIALAERDEGAELRALLTGTAVHVHSAADGARACALIDTLPPATVVVVDTPGMTASTAEQLAGDVAQLDGSVHLTLPVTMSAACARDAFEALAPLHPRCLALTRLDETRHPGGAVALALEAAVPVAYVAAGRDARGGLSPADAHALAAAVLP